jgi:hypothetical protein
MKTKKAKQWVLLAISILSTSIPLNGFAGLEDQLCEPKVPSLTHEQRLKKLETDLAGMNASFAESQPGSGPTSPQEPNRDLRFSPPSSPTNPLAEPPARYEGGYKNFKFTPPPSKQMKQPKKKEKCSSCCVVQ